MRDRSTVWAVEGRLAEEEDRPMRRYALRDDQWELLLPPVKWFYVKSHSPDLLPNHKKWWMPLKKQV